MKLPKWTQNIAFMLLALPASTNYQMHDYGFGPGGVDDASSNSYRMNAILGELSAGQEMSGSTYRLGPGLSFAQQADVPPAPTVSNPSDYYNKLLLVINVSDNPSDAVFAIAASTDNFSSDTQYVQSDNTLGATLGSEDYQTYTDWGSGSGSLIIGLDPNTTYTFKVKAMHGDFTETDFGPTAQATTSNPSVSYDIDVSSSDTETASPYLLDLGDLTPGSVVTGTDKIWVDIDTNGESGGFVYLYSSNGGLHSDSVSYTITSVTGNLTGVSEGFGVRSDSVTETSGGPLAPVSPFDGSGEVVGQVTTSSQTIFDSSSAPITGGRGAVLVKAKVSSTTPSANDYADTLTMIASGVF